MKLKRKRDPDWQWPEMSEAASTDATPRVTGSFHVRSVVNTGERNGVASP